jgi:hypothetical protein
MKKLGLVLALVILGTSAASAQSIRIGPGGVGVDLDGRDRRIERRVRDDRVIIRRDRDYRAYRSPRCRTTVVRRENRFGRVTVRRVRTCR